MGIILNLMVTLHDALYRNSDRAALNASITTPAQVITSDVSLAGYGKYTSKLFKKARADEIEFYADTNNDSLQEKIKFYVSNPPPTHRILYKKVDSETPFELARDVITFSISYYDIMGTAVSYGDDITGIKSIYIQLVIESSNTFSGALGGSTDSQPQKITWSSQIFPKNL